ncbi:molybdopterin-guanine dinucleotide biosynthesis protein B [Virgibacillus phasianinus]|uniref:Molybdopterin-guanine dinucleotide biosynthesis protein B n=1 Tax=Virgibacillus phasianinus TaxID=2017483 RepID=A0A220TYM9_9BACI|nr:molybdopterin-guanine dinucleotide biosynthesis protein B [Virgibacillus phasianinus]ASK60816.1 molybdopterin-guanine dinucleotide biosynthesis protein B [Virgibacillus phasianinus]
MANIIQIVGYKNAWKTTVVNRLVHHLADQNIRVGTLKHHGHGGDIELPAGTDSISHFESGSLVSGVQGESITQLTLCNLPFENLINVYSMFPIDFLLVEGFKQADYPKIVLLRNQEDLSLLDELSNIIAVATQDGSIRTGYPTFDLMKIDTCITQIASYIINN